MNKITLRPIRSDTQLCEAIRTIDSLLDQSNLNQDDKDYLEVLSILIEFYEAPLAPVSPVEMLKHLIEAKDVTSKEVAKNTKIAPSTISAILLGKRHMTLAHMKAFAKYFHVHTAVFLGE